MDNDIYLTIDRESLGLYKEKGSRFLSFAYPVSSESDIKNLLDQLKKEYYDARHHCYAYILGAKQDVFRAQDAGEPNHSAGDPILGQIRSKGLTDILVVVVRYFGGTKLGIPGLVHAYKTAAADALEQAHIVEKMIEENLEIEFEYPKINDVMRLIREYDVKIETQHFDVNCQMTLRVRSKFIDEIKNKLEECLMNNKKISD